MSDDRFSETTKSMPCPACATGFSRTPGANCPTCGQSFLSLSNPTREVGFRRGTERFRLDGPFWFTIGLVLLFGVWHLAVQIGPVIVIPVLIALIAALIRSTRLFPISENDPMFSLFTTFVAALGVSMLLVAVACIIAVAVVLAIVFLIPGITDPLEALLLLGIVIAVVVFLGLFVAFWPRHVSSSKIDHGED